MNPDSSVSVIAEDAAPLADFDKEVGTVIFVNVFPVIRKKKWRAGVPVLHFPTLQMESAVGRDTFFNSSRSISIERIFQFSSLDSACPVSFLLIGSNIYSF